MPVREGLDLKKMITEAETAGEDVIQVIPGDSKWILITAIRRWVEHR